MITQISRIQVRRGLQENLPSLASGELGWSIDQRRLYIGNGTAAEGAPTLGNTEILTNFSNIFNLSGVYTYTGLAAGYTAQTGPSLLDPAARTMQAKFDDVVNLRDFYTNDPIYFGDGVIHGPLAPTPDLIENPTTYINRAIVQLYKSTLVSSEARVRRTLNIPAGTYMLYGDAIRLLPYVRIKGEGKNSTFLIQADAGQPYALVSADSAGNVGAPVSPAISSIYSQLEDLTIINQTDNHVVQFDSTVNLEVISVRMQGALTNPSTAGNIKACLNLGVQSYVPANNLTFINCDFAGSNYGVYTNRTPYNINIINGSFTQLYRGVSLDEPGSTVPSAVRITNSLFDSIASEGIISTSSVSGVVSAFNTFKAVGNTNSTAVLNFNGANSYSIGDVFDRPFNANIAPVNLHSTASFATLPNGSLQLGRTTEVGGVIAVLLNDQPTQLTANLIVGAGTASTIVEYSIGRLSNSRLGQIKISPIGSSIVFDDEYVETGDTGVTLYPTIVGNIIDLQYTTSNASATANLTVSSRTLT